MKLVVLVPSADYLVNAGARIRYFRLKEALRVQGIDLSLVDIGTIDVDNCAADMLLISKCHDSRAHVVAIAAARRGIAVGVDLFDDYFSQPDDARMVRFRRWLSQLVPLLSFALASTPTMAEVIGAYRSDLPVKVVNDPAPRDGYGIAIPSADRIAAKFDDAANEQRLRFAWFGIGDNPHFAVGLHDLSAFSAELAALAQMTGMNVELAVLTNSRSLTAERLAMVAALPFRTQVDEWSEAAEASLLDSSFACFLPVNAQPFSAAKSLNRAVTALASGCQILSVGYPLYAPFNDLIYRDAETMASDVGSGNLRVSSARHAELVNALAKWGSADAEAKGLASFLSGIRQCPEIPLGQVAIMHGATTSGLAHKLAQKHGDITLSTPFAPPLPGVDALALAAAPLRFDLYIDKKLAKRAMLDPARLATEDGASKGFKRLNDDRPAPISHSRMNLAGAPLAVQLAFYETAIDEARVQLKRKLGVPTTVLSDMSPIPFPISVRGPGGS
jgi:hypothetical protein